MATPHRIQKPRSGVAERLPLFPEARWPVGVFLLSIVNALKTRKEIMRPIITSLAAAATLTAGLVAPVQSHASPSNAQTSITQESATANTGISHAVYYDLRSDSFEVSDSRASELGYSADEIQQFQQNLAELTSQESRELAEVIGIDVESLKMQRAIPAIVWVIAGFIGGAAADEIIGQVTNWGVSGACRNLAGSWDAFDDFCRSNGHL